MSIEAAQSELRLLRLLQLASPTLPVGAYSYSQGLEAAIEAGWVTSASSAERWIGDALVCSIARMDGPVLLRLCRAWACGDVTAAAAWNTRLLASRESAELRAETAQMGYSLCTLLKQLMDARPLSSLGTVAYPTAFAYAAAAWEIAPSDALTGFLWSWLENQVMTALKAVPLGQTDGQRMLVALARRAQAAVALSKSLDDESIGAMAPQLALLSARHESQYSRLFRS